MDHEINTAYDLNNTSISTPKIITRETSHENENNNNETFDSALYTNTDESVDYTLDTEHNPTVLLQKIKFANYNRIVIAHLNINSLRNKFDALREIKCASIDILIITESFSPSQFRIDGYNLPFRMHRTSEGAVLLYMSGRTSHVDN